MVRQRTPVMDWLDDLIGKGRAFASERQLALESGLSANAINNIRARGTASPDSLIAIADAAGISRVEAFERAGWLRQGDVTLPPMSPKQSRLYELVKDLPADDLALLVETAERLHRYASARA